MTGLQEEIALLAGEVKRLLLDTHKPKEWLYADASTYKFFKERAGKPAAKPAAQPMVPPPPPQPVPAARQAAPAKAPEAPKPIPKAAAAEPPPPPKKIAEPRGAIALEPLKETTGMDLTAMRSLMEKTAPHVIVNEVPAYKASAPRVKVIITAIGETPEGVEFLAKVCGAVTERICPARLAASAADVDATASLIVGTKATLQELPAGTAQHLQIEEAAAYLADPAKKAALWKLLCERCRGI